MFSSRSILHFTSQGLVPQEADFYGSHNPDSLAGFSKQEATARVSLGSCNYSLPSPLPARRWCQSPGAALLLGVFSNPVHSLQANPFMMISFTYSENATCFLRALQLLERDSYLSLERSGKTSQKRFFFSYAFIGESIRQEEQVRKQSKERALAKIWEICENVKSVRWGGVIVIV